MGSLEAKCERCGVTAAITNIGSKQTGYTIKPAGFGLADLCPVVKARTKEQEIKAPEDCPNLMRAIDARIAQFHKDNP